MARLFFIVTAALLLSEWAKSENACTELRIGEAKNIIGPTDHGANLRRYRLARWGDKSYEIAFNPEFTSPIIEREFLRCFSEGYQIKTSTGNEIKLRSNAGAPKIEIGESRSRSFAKRDQWFKGMDCSLMAHELLHWAGLCDEYKHSLLPELAKKMEGDPERFPCRRVRENNLMGSLAKNAAQTLTEDQFNQLVFPGCPINEKYSLCASFAYYGRSKECKKPSICLSKAVNGGGNLPKKNRTSETTSD